MTADLDQKYGLYDVCNLRYTRVTWAKKSWVSEVQKKKQKSRQNTKKCDSEIQAKKLKRKSEKKGQKTMSLGSKSMFAWLKNKVLYWLWTMGTLK